MLLYIWLNGPVLSIGDPTGEKVKPCCIGPAELIIGSLSRLKVSRLKGMWGVWF